MSIKIITAGILTCAVALPAQAATTIASTYTRISAGETVVAPFTGSAGVSSVGRYVGPFEVLVSGTGFSLGSRINDAFYSVASQTGLAGNFYHLGMGTSFSPLVPGNPALGAERFINFIENVGAVPFGTIPAFAVNNTYRFVADIGSTPSHIRFGVLDGNFGDNGGQYDITLWQLAPGVAAVPETATWLMLIAGFGMVGFAMRRQARATFATA